MRCRHHGPTLPLPPSARRKTLNFDPSYIEVDARVCVCILHSIGPRLSPATCSPTDAPRKSSRSGAASLKLYRIWISYCPRLIPLSPPLDLAATSTSEHPIQGIATATGLALAADAKTDQVLSGAQRIDSSPQLHKHWVEGIPHPPHRLSKPRSNLGPTLFVGDPDFVRKVE